MKSSLGFLIVLFLVLGTEVYSQVVLSEIMFDAAGNEAHDEFVEIYNRSESVPADLSGWRISDSADFDTIVGVNQGVVLQPGQFGIILDASYFDNSTAYTDRLPEDCLILTIDNSTFGSAGFSNSTPETVSLITSDGLVVSEYAYSLDNDAGFSDEKIDLNNSDSPANWANSRGLLGTPGAPNSVSPLNQDLAVFSEDLMFSPPKPRAGDTVTIMGVIKNLGLQPVQNFSAILYEDQNENSIPDANEEIGNFDFLNPVLGADSVIFEFVYENITAGPHDFLVEIAFGGDQDTTNNLTSKSLLVGYPDRALVINEIMYSPLSNQAEWVELYNPGSEAVSINSWRLADSDTTAASIIPADVLIPPAGYFVLAQDSSVLDLFNPPAGYFFVVSNWPSLNNSFDSVVLYDLIGNQMDRVNYNSNWGGGAGVALEKINPRFSANDSSGWNSCVAFLGGTPGEQNSIFTDVPVSEAAIAVSPNPFSPDGDGHDDFAIITFQLPLTTALVNVKIYDMRGRLIRFLANNESSGSQKTLIWDGHDDDGQRARIGIYVVYLQALNAQAGLIKSAKQTVVLAGRL